MPLDITQDDILNFETQQKDLQEKSGVEGNFAKDLFSDLSKVKIRAAEGIVQSAYNLVDWGMMDILPNYDKKFFGTSKTGIGSAFEFGLQFAIPYTAAVKGVSLASKAGKLGRFGSKLLTAGNVSKPAQLNWKGQMVAGAVADFTAFDGHEQRLSNLIEEFPSLRNPITDFLAAKEDDNEVVGRLKNAVEGAGFGLLFDGIVTGLSSIKKYRAGDKKGALQYIQDNELVFRSLMTNVNDAYRPLTYSPAIKALDTLKDPVIASEKIIETLSKQGLRGTVEELKWLELDNPERLKSLFTPEDYTPKGKIKKESLRRVLEEEQLSTVLTKIVSNQGYSTYTQEGGKNYREFVFQIHGKNARERLDSLRKLQKRTKTYTQHFDEVLKDVGAIEAHFRTKDRVGANGEKILYIEELQSDFFQRLDLARKIAKPKDKKIASLKAPLEESYLPSMLRQIIQVAAKEGYNSVAFPTGIKVADLYTDSFNVRLLESNPEAKTATFSFTNPKTGDEVVETLTTEIDSFIDKKKDGYLNFRSWTRQAPLVSIDQAKKLIKAAEEGKELKNFSFVMPVGGIIKQYDTAMVSALNRFGKSFNTKIESTPIFGDSEVIPLGGSPLDEIKAGVADYDPALKDILSNDLTPEIPNDAVRFEKFLDHIQKNYGEDNLYNANGLAFEDVLQNFSRSLSDKYDVDVDTDLIEAVGIDAFLPDFSNLLEKVNGFALIKDFFNSGAESNFSIERISKVDSYTFPISKEMSESVTKDGVSLWGARAAQNPEAAMLGNEISGDIRQKMGMAQYDSMTPRERAIAENIANVLRRPFPVGDSTLKVSDAFDHLETKGSTPEVRTLSKLLKNLFGDNPEVINTPIEAMYTSNGALGAFAPTPYGNRIEMYSNSVLTYKGEIDPKVIFNEGTMLHEIIHSGITNKIPPELSAANVYNRGSKYLESITQAVTNDTFTPQFKRMAELYKTALDNMPEQFKEIRNHLNNVNGLKPYTEFHTNVDEWYGFINIDEFITESMTNRKFQNFLKGIKTEGNRTLWQKFVDIIKDFVGVTGAKGTLLEDTIVAFTDLAKAQKGAFPMSRYYNSEIDRVFGSRSNKLFLEQAQEAHDQAIVDAAAEITLDPDSLQRGGKIALTGVTNSLKKVELGHDIDIILSESEKKIEEALRTSSKLTAENLENAGIVQAVDNLSQMSGQNADVIMGEVMASAKDAESLRRIAARMYTIESLASGQADNVYEAALKISKEGMGADNINEAALIGELKKMMYLVTAGSNLRRGFGQGLQSTQINRVKLSLNELEIKQKDIINEFMSGNSGKKINEIVNMILNESDPQDTVARMLGIAKAAKAADPVGLMEYAQNWYINSLLSGLRTPVKNGIGNIITNALINVEKAVGGLTVNPAITRQVLKEFSTLESFRESLHFFLKTWKNGDQLLDIGKSQIENVRRNERPIFFENATPEETMKNAFRWFGENVVNAPTKTLMSMDEVFKQTMFRQHAKLELLLKAMDMGIQNPDEIADYVAKGLDAILVDGERAFSNSNIIKSAQAKVREMDRLAVEAGGSPMKPSERGRKVQEIIEQETQKRGDMLKSVEQGGLGLQNLSDIEGLAMRSLEEARYATFTNDAGKAAELVGGLTQSVPLLKFIFPFVRTPINLLKFSFDRASFAAPEVTRRLLAKLPDMPMLAKTQQDLRLQLQSRSPLERAAANGKLATATMINATLMYMIMSNREILTGGGPKDINQRKTLEGTGWQRYSFKVGNKYYSYSGLDPFGTHFGVLVDLFDQMEDANSVNSTIFEQVFTAVGISMTRNVTEKSYLAGLQFLSDALSEPDRKLPRMMQNLAAGFVPNILYQGQSIVGDTTVRETRNLADALLKKLPMGNDNLDPKRNLLGEPIILEQVPLFGALNPSAISTRDNDIVFEELAQLEHGFSNVSPVLDRLIDTTEFANASGQSAYDRRMELMGQLKIQGKTLRQALEQVIKDKRYQSISPFSEAGFKSPRVDLLNKVLTRYRAASLQMMLKEFPEIDDKYRRIKKAKVMSRQGAQANELQQLLNMGNG